MVSKSKSGKRLGRPPKPPCEVRWETVGVRLRAATKAQLRQAADQNGRSMGEEAEARLEASFLGDSLPEAVADAVVRRLAPPAPTEVPTDIPLGLTGKPRQHAAHTVGRLRELLADYADGVPILFHGAGRLGMRLLSVYPAAGKVHVDVDRGDD